MTKRRPIHPKVPNMTVQTAIRLPEDEVAEAQALVNDLLADMLKDS